MLRRILGWVDTDGNPTREQLQFSYRELMERAGISRQAVAEAIDEALKHKMVLCLQAPGSSRPGFSGISGIYALRWSDCYTDSPAEFSGFFQREAVAMEGDGLARPVAVAKAARKNIPNAFFDYVLPRERLSVVRVVGAMLFKSIQWGPGGERKVPVSLSITELCWLSHLTRRHVHEAMQYSIEHGYVELLTEGTFDRNAGANSHAATYRIRWTSQAVSPVYAPSPEAQPLSPQTEVAPYPFSDRSKMGHGDAVKKGKREQSEMGYGDRFKKGNGISIKTSVNNQTAATPGELCSSTITAAAASGVVGKLVKAGYDVPTAMQLAAAHPSAVIERQLDWLPLRQPTRNRLGLLRRAIEQDWAKPETSIATEIPLLGSLFARNYEAAFHQRPDLPGSCSPKEATQALEFLRRIEPIPTEAQAAEWGRSFGRFARAKAPLKPWLVWVLRLHGEEFLRRRQHDARHVQNQSKAEARRAREEQLRPAYLTYLHDREARCQLEQPEFYAAFEAHRAELEGKFSLSDRSRAILASETGRLTAFADFAREHGQALLEFREWARKLSSQSDIKPASDLSTGSTSSASDPTD